MNKTLKEWCNHPEQVGIGAKIEIDETTAEPEFMNSSLTFRGVQRQVKAQTERNENLKKKLIMDFTDI